MAVSGEGPSGRARATRSGRRVLAVVAAVIVVLFVAVLVASRMGPGAPHGAAPPPHATGGPSIFAAPDASR